MGRAVKSLLVLGSFAAAGCASAPNGVEVRPIANPAAKLRPGADLLADAKGQLALGNVGLALEGFRKAARLYPDNVEAYAGMAACYETMRRYDLAELKYQAALAVAPRNPTLLTRLAGALEQQGKSEAAAEVRGEIAQLASASAALDDAQAEDVPAEASLAPAQTVSVALPTPKLAAAPEALAVAVIEPPAPAIPAPQLNARTPLNLLAGLSPQLTPMRVGRLAPELALVVEPAAPKLPAPRLNDRAPINLLAAFSQRLNPLAVRELAPLIAVPAEPAPATVAAPRLYPRATTGNAPRLERTSLGEVALLTGDGPVWRGQVVAATPQKLTVRWVPMTMAAARPNIRLLNAARVQGLAARNRDYLLDRGWRKIAIGDATEARERTLVLYPASRPTLGRSLAAQFGCRARPAETGGVFLVFLGRDAGSKATPARG